MKKLFQTRIDEETLNKIKLMCDEKNWNRQTYFKEAVDRMFEEISQDKSIKIEKLLQARINEKTFKKAKAIMVKNEWSMKELLTKLISIAFEDLFNNESILESKEPVIKMNKNKLNLKKIVKK